MNKDELIAAGIPPALAKEQIRLLARGTLYADIVRSASIDDGILRFEDSDRDMYREIYLSREREVKVLKFVPASGAATRMFKSLLAYRETAESNEKVEEFFKHLSLYPFADLLPLEGSREEIMTVLFDGEHLNYQNQPKGIIPFHSYEEGPRTAFEEHLVEGSAFALSEGEVHIHFTLSSSKMDQIEQEMKAWASNYEKELGCTFHLEFSTQLPRTDTIAIDNDGEVYRTTEGHLFLRPGGHGALIHNLSTLKADIIFIKNVDNVVTDAKRADTIHWKEALAGMLIAVRREARVIIEGLKSGTITQNQVLDFLYRMGYEAKENIDQTELIRLMNRPYRVCGMVRNEGEPGGGPFWVRKGNATCLQIVESAEINPQSEAQLEMLRQGTHFNPVDLVCCLNDLYGQRQDLMKFVDAEAAFVTQKSIGGRDFKVLEWPGLWNGAMADWNTVFVEVPISTFNPVKEVNDLLRPMHQSLDSQS